MTPKALKTSKPGISIIQITDSHILEKGVIFKNYDTTKSLNLLIKTIKEKETDCILFTGDLVQKPSQLAYQALASCLACLRVPLYYLPGNHDDPALMQSVMTANGFPLSKLIKIQAWLIILLNSHQVATHSGYLSTAELTFLETSLAENPNSHCLIALHHPPVPINSQWLDKISLENSNQFLAVIDQFPQVKGIIHGHIHQEFSVLRKQVKLLGSPSTCWQFTANSDTFGIDNKPPGYRHLWLAKDGAIDTQVYYL